MQKLDWLKHAAEIGRLIREAEAAERRREELLKRARKG